MVEKTGVEADSSLGLCEKYRQPIREVYRKLKMSHPQMPNKAILSHAVK